MPTGRPRSAATLRMRWYRSRASSTDSWDRLMPGDVHARLDQPLEGALVLRGGADGGDDLRPTSHGRQRYRAQESRPVTPR